MRKQLSIGAKIITMAVVIAAIAAGIGIVGLTSTQRSGDLVKGIYDQNLLGIKYAKEIKYQAQAMAVGLLNANLQKTPEGVKKYQDTFNAAYGLYMEAIQDYQATVDDDKERSLIKTIAESGGEYHTLSQDMFDFFSKGQMAEANAYGVKYLAPVRAERLNPAVEELVSYNEKSGETSYAASIGITRNAVLTIILAIFIGLAVSLVLAFVITRGITGPVSGIVTNLSESSSQIAVSSTQLSDSSQEIANGASEQAAGIEETTASIEELTSMVKQNLENAKQASLLSEKATEASQDGSAQMELMSGAMAAISKSTEEIKTVIDVIDDIAFQTNMLALNAAVEAARAGEAGMGFAVVADEVKNLANRSSESAKETSSMIKATLKNVEEGMGISKALSEIFKEILANSRKVLEMTKEVESASSQQDLGISQVNKAIIQFDSVVQTNASSAEETASAAEEMQGQVGTLKDVVVELYRLVTGKAFDVETNAAHAPAKTSAKRLAAPAKAPTSGRSGRVQGADKNTGRSGDEGKHIISFEDDEDFKAED